jgi:hypothetical protein
VHPHALAADPHPRVAEVDLQLLPGAVSNRVVASVRAFSSRRQHRTRSSTERRPMTMPCSLSSSCQITTAFPARRKNRSRSQSSSPSNTVRRCGLRNGAGQPKPTQNTLMLLK